MRPTTYESWRAFNRAWFARHQRTLVWLLALPIVGRVLRRILRITRDDVGYRGRIVEILPYAYVVQHANGSKTADFRTHDKYAKRLYHAFKPLWWAMHAWDWAVADRWVPAWSAGFSTLTAFPDANPESTTVDGIVAQAFGATLSWANIRTAAGNYSDDTSSSEAIVRIVANTGTSDVWDGNNRAIFLFDTSALTSSASISAATLSLFGTSKQDGLSITPNYDIYPSTPASNTALVNADYAQVGTTSQTGSPIAYGSFSTSAYNDSAFNATGLGNISKTGISKFGVRNASYDAAGVAPTWSSTATPSELRINFADQAGTTNDPKLVVTYTVPTVVTATDSVKVQATEAVSAFDPTAQSPRETLHVGLTEAVTAGEWVRVTGTGEQGKVQFSERAVVAVRDAPVGVESLSVRASEMASVSVLSEFNRPVWRLYAELAGSGNGWTDLTGDWYQGAGFSFSRGIDGSGPTARVARTGTMSFSLLNEANTAGIRGYYSPGHVNCRPGFARGIGVKLTLMVNNAEELNQFVGELRIARPEPNIHGQRLTACQAVDWMFHAGRFRVSDIPLQTDATDNAIFSLLVAGVPVQPRALETHTGFDTFLYALDNSKAERAYLLEEFKRLAQSSLSRVYVQRDGTLTYETRDVRPKLRPNVVLAIVDTDMPEGAESLVAADDQSEVVTKVQVTIHPRSVEGGIGTEVVLYSLASATRVEPGVAILIRGLFTKPGQEAFRVGGLDMLDPVATTDYLVNSADDGSGTDLTASVTVDAIYQANSVLFEVTNNSSQVGFITKLQARGIAVIDQQDTVVEQEIENPQGIPQNVITLDMPYQTDPALAIEEAQYELHVANQQDRRAKSVTVSLSRQSTSVRARAIAVREISDRVNITEAMTAMPISSSETYYINSVACSVDGGGRIRYTYGLELADQTQYWILDQVGYSELGQTTVLGFGLVIGHTDFAHIDTSHGDIAHGDTAHTDTAHGDAAHGDAGTHLDVAHSDTAHADANHNDSAHQDVAHGDSAHSDSHSDTAHSDVAHNDVVHVDVHEDNYEPLTDTHTDTHNDIAHGDSHTDVAHNDTHGDSAHSDSAHVDEAHEDIAHGDTLHSDVAHGDNSHTDTAHDDVAHGDVSHSDNAHSDVEHGDTPHGDEN